MISYVLIILLLVLAATWFVFGVSFFRHLTLGKSIVILAFLFLCSFVLLVNYQVREEARSFAYLEETERYRVLVDMYLNGENLPNPESIDARSFIRAFQRYLQGNSRDYHAWSALGNILTAAGLEETSITAYERAYRLKPTDIDAAIAFVNARLSLAKAQGSGELDLLVIEVLDNVLRQYPDHGNALMLKGAAGLQGGDYLLAVNSWLRVKELFELREQRTGEPMPEEVMSALEASIARAEALNKGEIEEVNSNGFSQAIEIALSPSLFNDIDRIRQQNPSLTLFVFVHSASRPETPMPLAAFRREIDNNEVFPIKVRLDNSHSLLGTDLSSQGELIVAARLSLSGEAKRGDEDLGSEQKRFDPATSKDVIKLEIK